MVPKLLGATGMALQQQTLCLHDLVEPLVIGWALAPLTRLAQQESMHPLVAHSETLGHVLSGPLGQVGRWNRPEFVPPHLG